MQLVLRDHLLIVIYNSHLWPTAEKEEMWTFTLQADVQIASHFIQPPLSVEEISWAFSRN